MLKCYFKKTIIVLLSLLLNLKDGICRGLGEWGPKFFSLFVLSWGSLRAPPPSIASSKVIVVFIFGFFDFFFVIECLLLNGDYCTMICLCIDRLVNPELVLSWQFVFIVCRLYYPICAFVHLHNLHVFVCSPSCWFIRSKYNIPNLYISLALKPLHLLEKEGKHLFYPPVPELFLRLLHHL